jgi:para-nitrobenzyl esterase
VETSSNKEAKSGVNEYDGQALATSTNSVVVSLNYRIGSLGFLAHPALTASNPEHTSGNYGLLDVILALRWVQSNIASFGGDRSHVMLFGQSAGAIDTCALVSSPLAHGLFSTALMESGNCGAESFTDRYVTGNKFVDAVHCTNVEDVVACLQNAPINALALQGDTGFLTGMVAEFKGQVDPKHIVDLPFAPTVDNYVLEDVPSEVIKAGKHNHVPLVIGTNAEEMSLLLPSFVISNCLEYEAIVNHMLPDVGSSLLAAYPCDKNDETKSAERQFVSAVTDAFFTCPSRRALRAAAASQSEPVYRYLFSHAYSSGPKAGDGAYHTAEIPYVFGTFGSIPYTPTTGEAALSQQMQRFWTSFAASGNPNGTAGSSWSRYDPIADSAIQLDVPLGTTSRIDASGCDFWDTVQ